MTNISKEHSLDFKNDFIANFLHAVANSEASEFTRRTMTEHYIDAVLFHHPNSANLDHKQIQTKVIKLINRIFDELALLNNKPQQLATRLLELGRKQQSRIPEWFVEFDEAYDHYKKISKLPFIGSFLLPYMQATQSLLDFGCGDGEIAMYLGKELGLSSVAGVDVIDWRSDSNRNNPNFVFYEHNFVTNNSNDIPAHDTGLMHAMLHHVSREPAKIVEYLLRAKNAINGQILVVEDVLFDAKLHVSNIPGIESLNQTRNSQPNFAEYLAKPVEVQRDVITILDLLSNSLAMGIPEMNFPFGAQEINTWGDIFQMAGLKMRTLKVLGFQDHLFHRMSQVLFVLETYDS